MGTLCLTPFDIYSIDSSSIPLPAFLESGFGLSQSLISIVIETAKYYLSDFGPTREAAAICLSSMLTRPDATVTFLDSFFDYAINKFEAYLSLSQSNASQQQHCLHLGILFTLNQVLKRGDRNKLIGLFAKIKNLYFVSIRIIELQTNQTLERKMLCKLIQRIGMTLLSPRNATWRYQKNYRTMNLQQSKKPLEEVSVDVVTSTTNQSEENIEIPEEIEEILDKMISFLSDKDTVVRWSAAKGVGRLTMRLTKSLGMDIINAIIQQFEDKTNENFWHGGCLALAELSRRGLLLPHSLSLVFPIILEALNFDQQKGQHYVGANIRDAACYVSWAFARAYSPVLLKPFVKDFSASLLTTALFDREINCRRAASAAFQENVGRQGNENFSNGIDIITIADFFAVSNRFRSFLDLPAQIVALDIQRYFHPFLSHLIEHKINHWDKDMRELTSKAVPKLFLAVFTEEYQRKSQQLGENFNESTNQLVRELLDGCLSDHLYTRHGSLLTLTRLLQVLVQYCLNTEFSFSLSQDNHQLLENLIPTIEKKRLYRGKGGEFIREAVCLLIETLSKLRFLFVNSKLLVAIIDCLNDHLKQPQIHIQLAAKAALRQFLFFYFAERRVVPLNPFPNDKIIALTVNKYISVLRSSEECNVAIIRGFIMALGTLPDRFVLLPNRSVSYETKDKESTFPNQVCGESDQTNLDIIFSILEEYSSNTKLINGEYDAETCQHAIESTVELTERLISSYLFNEKYLMRGFKIVFKGAEDYSIDKRGDTGSWARIVSIQGIERLLAVYFANLTLYHNYERLSSNTENSLVGKFVQTAYGLGIISRLIDKPSDGPLLMDKVQYFRSAQSLFIEFSDHSLGSGESSKDLWISLSPSNNQRPQLVFQSEVNISTSYVQYDKMVDNLQFYSSFYSDEKNSSVLRDCMQILLKQVSEKLDSVRYIAGNIIQRLLFSKFGLLEFADETHKSSVIRFDFPDEDILVSSIHFVVENLKNNDDLILKLQNQVTSRQVDPTDIPLTESNEEEKAEDEPEEELRTDQNKQVFLINWHRPDHVFQVVVRCLRSRIYFQPIFSGLVVSMGGLTEAIVKSSQSAFISFCKVIVSDGDLKYLSTFLFLMTTSIEQLFVVYAKNDRIILPLLKTIILILKENIINNMLQGQRLLLPEDQFHALLHEVNEFYNRLILKFLFEELQSTSQITKLLLIVDAYILFLTIVHNSVDGYRIQRKKTFFYLVQLLSHRFPRVRKCNNSRSSFHSVATFLTVS
jgi:hypothetical protein